ncbi:MAG: ferredoxin [Cyanobacteriota bacterium]
MAFDGPVDPGLAFSVEADAPPPRTGREPLLGGALRQKAVWVDEAVCIGCRYCAHVAANTFVVEAEWGRSRVIRQDGDTTERIQEAIDTCPVDCIHWVPYEELSELRRQRDNQELLPLGLPSAVRVKRILPRSAGGHAKVSSPSAGSDPAADPPAS